MNFIKRKKKKRKENFDFSFLLNDRPHFFQISESVNKSPKNHLDFGQLTAKFVA